MSESFIPASEFETASNAVSNILGQPVEEIKITDILPPLNDIADSNKVFKGKLSVLFVDMRKSTDLTDELKSKKMVKVYRSFIRIVIQAIRYSGGYTRQFAGDGIMGIFQNSNVDDQNISSSCKAIKAARYLHARPAEPSANPACLCCCQFPAPDTSAPGLSQKPPAPDQPFLPLPRDKEDFLPLRNDGSKTRHHF